MKIFKTVAEMQAWSLKTLRRGASIGFVPTMGALHTGHLSLVSRSVRENDVTVVSIFVNPLQFGPKEDFKKYPRTVSRDLALLKKARVDVVFLPSTDEMYAASPATTISVPALDSLLEGASRPGHFTGVATVVAKLFHITQATRAYFGLKDYQQVRVIQTMVQDLNLPIHIVGCPTWREPDGLAGSSRNRYLSKAERQEAVKLYQALFLGRELVSEKIMTQTSPLRNRLLQIFKRIPRCRVDYIQVVDPVTLQPLKRIRRPALLMAAVWIGKTRLIDNLIIS